MRSIDELAVLGHQFKLAEDKTIEAKHLMFEHDFISN